MDAGQRARAEALFEAALERPAAGREAWLREAAADEGVRQLALRLLAAHCRADGVLDAPPEHLASLLEAAQEPAPAAPSRLGPFRIEREIGHGGMGRVYLAERDDGHFRQRVAIKLIRGGLDAAEHLRRFRAERQILASLQHPNIARLLDGGVAGDGRPYLVMEYVNGESLTAYCDARRLPLAERLRLFQQVCAAVAYAHRNLVVHRDLKPGNILVTAEGEVKLLDFGIAKLLGEGRLAADEEATRAGAWVLTPEYAAPEQLRGGPITTATDVYGLGLVLYELLCGCRLLELAGRSWGEVERVVCEVEPPRPSERLRRSERSDPTAHHAVAAAARARATDARRLAQALHGDLDNIVLTALRKEPERRYASAAALSEDLERHLSGQPVAARGRSARYRVGRFVRRHRWGVAAAAVIVLLLAAYAATATVQARRIGQALARANVETEKARLEARKAERVTGFLTALFEASDPAEARGDSITAGELLQRGVQRADLLRGEPLVQAQLLHVVGRVYLSLGRHEPARALLERALALRRQHAGERSADVAQSLHALAELQRRSGDYPAAEAALRRALVIRTALHGRESAEAASERSALAILLADRGDFARSRQLHRAALAVRQRQLGPQHLDVAESLAGLAFVAHNTGALAEADSLYRQALAIRRSRLGELHPDVAVTLNNLASLRVEQGDYAAAERIYRQVLASRRRLFGAEHPSVATTLNNLAHARFLQGDHAAADTLLRQVLAMRRRLLGAEHPAVATAMNNLAFVHLRRGDLAIAELLFRQVILIQRRRVGDDHPNTAGALHNLGLLLQQKGALDDAERHFRQAHATRLRLFGAQHPDVAASLHDLGTLRQQRGDGAAAESLFTQALTLRRRLLGDDHPRTRESREALAAAGSKPGRGSAP